MQSLIPSRCDRKKEMSGINKNVYVPGANGSFEPGDEDLSQYVEIAWSNKTVHSFGYLVGLRQKRNTFVAKGFRILKRLCLNSFTYLRIPERQADKILPYIITLLPRYQFKFFKVFNNLSAIFFTRCCIQWCWQTSMKRRTSCVLAAGMKDGYFHTC